MLHSRTARHSVEVKTLPGISANEIILTKSLKLSELKWFCHCVSFGINNEYLSELCLLNFQRSSHNSEHPLQVKNLVSFCVFKRSTDRPLKWVNHCVIALIVILVSLFFKNSRTLLFLIWFVRALRPAISNSWIAKVRAGRGIIVIQKKTEKDGSPHAYYIYFCLNSSYFHLTFFFFHIFQSYWTFKLFYFSNFKYFWFIRIILNFSFRFSCPLTNSIRKLAP